MSIFETPELHHLPGESREQLIGRLGSEYKRGVQFLVQDKGIQLPRHTLAESDIVLTLDSELQGFPDVYKAPVHEQLLQNAHILNDHRGKEWQFILERLVNSIGFNQARLASVIAELPNLFPDDTAEISYEEPTLGLPIIHLTPQAVSILQKKRILPAQIAGVYFTRQESSGGVACEFVMDTKKEKYRKRLRQVIEHETHHFIWDALEKSKYQHTLDHEDSSYRLFRNEIVARLASNEDLQHADVYALMGRHLFDTKKQKWIVDLDQALVASEVQALIVLRMGQELASFANLSKDGFIPLVLSSAGNGLNKESGFAAVEDAVLSYIPKGMRISEEQLLSLITIWGNYVNNTLLPPHVVTNVFEKMRAQLSLSIPDGIQKNALEHAFKTKEETSLRNAKFFADDAKGFLSIMGLSGAELVDETFSEFLLDVWKKPFTDMFLPDDSKRKLVTALQKLPEDNMEYLDFAKTQTPADFFNNIINFVFLDKITPEEKTALIEFLTVDQYVARAFLRSAGAVLELSLNEEDDFIPLTQRTPEESEEIITKLGEFHNIVAIIERYTEVGRR